MIPVDAESASALLQYGALGIVVLMLLLGSWFGLFLARMFERNVKDLTDTVRDGFKDTNGNLNQTRHNLNNALTRVQENLLERIDGRDSSRITLPSPKPPH
jgi:hypothetical protein